MKKNVGTVDKIVRIVLALIATYFAYTRDFVESPWIGYLLWIIAFVLLITALTSRCGLYALLGKSTCEVNYNK
ncbi:YgaP family membrane protein [Urechidicola croceus]|uniref:Inner membrane protein YgaP-like transmembrane domain-containing protein n=1 Tax=Urechidicola croceus TaxID=1850246 RepID=A0A1D8PAD8_9FLAO|nr:DUF2892 domain-containing protein [Urechidicola croceus]AOW21496.1 hypothetical protein LPB138_12760 [Urechidicola croceus]